MPSKLPRVQVRLTPEQYAAIADVAKGARLSMSRVVADIIEPHLPVMRSVAQMLKDAAAMTEEARAALRPMLDSSARKLEASAVRAYATLAETEAVIRKASSRAPDGGAAPARARRMGARGKPGPTDPPE